MHCSGLYADSILNSEDDDDVEEETQAETRRIARKMPRWDIFSLPVSC